MIPKIIHYIWLGHGEMPKVAQKCIASWKKFCPDFQIMRWDETNVDLNKYDYVKEAYNAKKYAFASDVIRLEKLYEYGGIYLDIDVELIKPLENLLNQNCFVGFETNCLLNPGLIFATEKQNEDLKNILDIYSTKHFIVDYKADTTTICQIVTDYYAKQGLLKNNKTQKLNNITVYSSEYFSPIDVITNKKLITENTYSIHWYNASWYSPWQKFKRFCKKMFNFLTFGAFGKILQKKRDRK